MDGGEDWLFWNIVEAGRKHWHCSSSPGQTRTSCLYDVFLCVKSLIAPIHILLFSFWAFRHGFAFWELLSSARSIYSNSKVNLVMACKEQKKPSFSFPFFLFHSLAKFHSNIHLIQPIYHALDPQVSLFQQIHGYPRLTPRTHLQCHSTSPPEVHEAGSSSAQSKQPTAISCTPHQDQP